MSIVHWNPWREFDDFFRTSAVAGAPGEGMTRSDWLPPVDITETDKDYRIDVEIPGFAAGDVDVSVHEGVLTVTGERNAESRTEGKRHRVERRWGSFARSFRLPEHADEDRIEARSRDGVLHLVVPKKDQPGARNIEVKTH